MELAHRRRPGVAMTFSTPRAEGVRRLIRGLRHGRHFRTRITTTVGVRARVVGAINLLVAAGLLTAILATRQVLFDNTNDEIEALLTQEVEELRRLTVGVNPTTGELFGDDSAAVFDTFLSRNVPAKDEAFFTISSGRPYASSFDPPVQLLSIDEVVRGWAALTEPTRASVNTVAGEARYLAVPLTGSGQAPAVFVVAIFSSERTGDVNEVVTVLLVASLVVMLATVIVSWSLASTVTRPLRDLTRAATRVSEAELSTRIPERGNDELAQLSRTFNAMMDRLEDAFRLRQEFLDDVAHELRTPITVVRGHLELMSNEPSERAQTVALVTDELDQMNRYVSDLLLLARAEHRDFLQLAVVDMAELAESVLVRASALARRQWILDTRPQLRQVTCLADRARLGQALINLCDNAARHTADGDQIGIGVHQIGDRVLLWVRDTGSGIDAATRERLFNRFSRGPGRQDGQSTGLGLAIVASIAKAHGGAVDVVSSAGKGATFTISLPVHDGSDPHRSPSS